VIDLLPPVVAATPARPGPSGNGRAGAGDDAPADFAALLAALAGAVAGPTPGAGHDAGEPDALAEGLTGEVAVGAETVGDVVGDPAGQHVAEELAPAGPTPIGDLAGVASEAEVEAEVDDVPAAPAIARPDAAAGKGGRPAEAGAAKRADAAPTPAGTHPGGDTRPVDAEARPAGPAEPAPPVAHDRATTTSPAADQDGLEPGKAMRATGPEPGPGQPADAGRAQADPARPAAPAAPANGAAVAAPAAPATPAVAPAPAAAAAPHVPVEQSVAEQVVTRVSALRLEAGRSELSIDLHPLELGRLRVELTLEDGSLRVALRAESGATGDLLRRAVPELRAALEEAGLGVADLHVGPDHRPDAQHPGTPGGATGDGAPSPDAGAAPTAGAGADEADPTDPTDPSGRHGLDLLL
jgi:flagellar hook-length control protein FliK